MRWEVRESGRCAEVRANWRSGAALNRREKREKAGAIEGEKEGARYGSGVFLMPFVFIYFLQIIERTHLRGHLGVEI